MDTAGFLVRAASPVFFSLAGEVSSPDGAMFENSGWKVRPLGNNAGWASALGSHESNTFVGPGMLRSKDHAHWRDREKDGYDAPLQ